MSDAGPLDAAIAAIDRINSQDPTLIVVAGSPQPKELEHARRMTHWLRRLVPEPTPAQEIAARAHHLRRWASPRDAFPEGRAGYLRWRAAARRRHVAEVSELLEGQGFDPAMIAEVARIMAKEGRTSHADVQAHEDALCLTFCELQLEEMIDRLGRDHTVSVVRKTLAKMSPAARAMAADVPMSDAARLVIDEAAAAG